MRAVLLLLLVVTGDSIAVSVDARTKTNTQWLAEEISKLATLRDSGALTAKEFTAAKAQAIKAGEQKEISPEVAALASEHGSPAASLTPQQEPTPPLEDVESAPIDKPCATAPDARNGELVCQERAYCKWVNRNHDWLCAVDEEKLQEDRVTRANAVNLVGTLQVAGAAAPLASAEESKGPTESNGITVKFDVLTSVEAAPVYMAMEGPPLAAASAATPAAPDTIVLKGLVNDDSLNGKEFVVKARLSNDAITIEHTEVPASPQAEPMIEVPKQSSTQTVEQAVYGAYGHADIDALAPGAGLVAAPGLVALAAVPSDCDTATHPGVCAERGDCTWANDACKTSDSAILTSLVGTPAAAISSDCDTTTNAAVCAERGCAWANDACKDSNSAIPISLAAAPLSECDTTTNAAVCAERGCAWANGGCGKPMAATPSECETTTNAAVCAERGSCAWVNDACHNQ